MGLVYADIELINGGDLELVHRNLMDKDEVKRMWVTALVDTGSYMLCINENIKEQLGLRVLETRKGQMADGSIIERDVVGPIELRFKIAERLPMPWYFQPTMKCSLAPFPWKTWTFSFIHSGRNSSLIPITHILPK